MEHAQLVMNAIARFESLMRPMFDARPPEARARLSREMIDWLAASPDSFLRAALLDGPCPTRFFEKWAPAEQIKTWQLNAPGCCPDPTAKPGGADCMRPSDFFAALCAKKQK